MCTRKANAPSPAQRDEPIDGWPRRAGGAHANGAVKTEADLVECVVDSSGGDRGVAKVR